MYKDKLKKEARKLKINKLKDGNHIVVLKRLSTISSPGLGQ